MFRLFKKDLTRMEKHEIKELQRILKEIQNRCTDLKGLLDSSAHWEQKKAEGKEEKKKAENALKENSDLAKSALREILRELHHGTQEVVKALEAELEKQYKV
ncbi:hypothetical protein AYK26_02915 [Euryarchaeota archaeon SM23-78]|nr:MAG: hypothetical protein AYK26_02915 [Euryarchaeota archaeon SM23-78]MBW3000394.1 hypothetical protein [Candidatus Woesearchaeota archaeon]